METDKEILTIQTPEHVGFQYVLAGLGTRAMAFIVDTQSPDAPQVGSFGQWPLFWIHLYGDCSFSL